MTDFNPGSGLQGVVLVDNANGLGGETAPLHILPPFARTGSGTADFTPGGSYAIGASVGGLISVDTGLPATTMRLTGIGLVVPMTSNTTPGSNAVVVVFNGEPTGPFSDGAVPTWIAADTNKIRRAPTFTFVYGPSSGSLASYASQTSALPIDVTTDAAGMLFFVMVGTAITWDTPGSARFTVDYLY